jgi:hypothetical protein
MFRIQCSASVDFEPQPPAPIHVDPLTKAGVVTNDPSHATRSVFLWQEQSGCRPVRFGDYP